MNVAVIAGFSKGKGNQFSLKHEYVLTKEGAVMTYSNLRSHFGCPPADTSLSDYSTPYRAGIHLYNYVRKQGNECTLINFLDAEQEIFEEAARSHPDVVAISTSFLISIRAVKRVTEIVKRYTPRAKIVVGGPLVYNSYLLYQKRGTDYHLEPCRQDYFFIGEESQYNEDIDFFVVEEQGEASFIRLINTLAAGEDPSNVPNLAFYKGGEITFTVREAENNNFSSDLVNWQQVPTRYLHPIYPVRGSRGCPYRCKYCNFATHRSFLIKPHDVLASELCSLSTSGRVQIVRFTDDNLFLNRKNLELFCETIIKSSGGMKWTSFIRANSITRDNITLLKESGCLLAQIGMESGDSAMLARMNKKEDPDSYLEAIELLNTHGIFTQLYFIVGFPGETNETIDNTVRLINQFRHDGPAVNFIMVFPFVLAPLSPIYAPKQRTACGLTGYMSEWRHSTMDSKQAATHARELLLRIENVFPFYGIEELAVLDAKMLKKLSHLRLSLRKAEMSTAPTAEIDRLWNELRVLVAGAPSNC
jgi:anaerobic magnesium-protoporphyrin IX monomethyl ester cyclase